MKIHALYYGPLIVVMLAMVSPLAASSSQPMDVLREKVIQGLAVLNDPQYSAPAARALLEERLWQLSQTLFDFTTMSRLVLAGHWKNFTVRQQKVFVKEFAAFLRRAYLPVLLEQYNGEQIEFVRQVQLSPTRARVEVYVLWADRKVPITVRMVNRQGDWRVYDVSTLGISAVKNYRAQFRWLLLRNPPDQVIEQLRNRKGHAL
ncbi:MAG: ABC transporter substrate-binding protein [Desulfobacterales bacterium]